MVQRGQFRDNRRCAKEFAGWDDIDELRQRLITVWCELEQRIVDDAVDQWRRRLLACVDAEGGHFEHSL